MCSRLVPWYWYITSLQETRFRLHPTRYQALVGEDRDTWNTTRHLGGLTCAWLKTVVMLKHPGHFTSMKKLKRSRVCVRHGHKSEPIRHWTKATTRSRIDCTITSDASGTMRLQKLKETRCLYLMYQVPSRKHLIFMSGSSQQTPGTWNATLLLIVADTTGKKM